LERLSFPQYLYHFGNKTVKYLIKFEILTLTLDFLIFNLKEVIIVINNELDSFHLDFII